MQKGEWKEQIVNKNPPTSSIFPRVKVIVLISSRNFRTFNIPAETPMDWCCLCCSIRVLGPRGVWCGCTNFEACTSSPITSCYVRLHFQNAIRLIQIYKQSTYLHIWAHPRLKYKQNRIPLLFGLLNSHWAASS